MEQRFGIVPNSFRLAPETPEITEKLWGSHKLRTLTILFLPSLKERLFVYLSRSCVVRYCIARHVGFLVGLGRPAGDTAATPSKRCRSRQDAEAPISSRATT